MSVHFAFSILVLVGGVTPDYGDQSRDRQEAYDAIGSDQPLRGINRDEEGPNHGVILRAIDFSCSRS
jgi:hypothetical protein